MISKLIERNIPPERENTNDRFRVKYNSRQDFIKLLVKITRLVNGEQQLFEFDANSLPDTDSIYFTTSLMNNKLQVIWHNIVPTFLSKDETEQILPTITKTPVNRDEKKGKIAFPPIANERSRILILGTMPGERSLLLQQYYGHGGNHFWKIMYALFEKPFNKDYKDRKKLLLENRIALWDVIEYCEGEGSADSAIINEKANDFASFYNEHPAIQHVFFTSQKAAGFYDAYIKRKPQFGYNLLPSPSSMNTWKTLDEKIAEWKLILKYL